MESDDAESDWPLTQGGWLSYGQSQEQVPVEQVADPVQEEAPDPDQAWADSDTDLDREHGTEQELDGPVDEASQEQQTSQRSRKSGASKTESTRGHLLPVFFQAPKETENLESFRKLHMEGLGQLLRRLLVRRDLQTASEIFEVLFDAKDTSEEFIWKIGLEFLYSMNMYDEQVHKFLSWLFSKSRYHKQAILLELVLYQLRCGEIEEAELSLRAHVTVVPYDKDPLIQGYAGLVKMLLLEKAIAGASRIPWRIYTRWNPNASGHVAENQDLHFIPWRRDPVQNLGAMTWNNQRPSELPEGADEWTMDNLDEGEALTWDNDELIRRLIDVPLRNTYSWTMEGLDGNDDVSDSANDRPPRRPPQSQSTAPDRLKQDAINHLEKSLELEPANDEFLQALVDVRLEFFDFSHFDPSHPPNISPELQEAIVETKIFLRKHLRRNESLKALHILASLEAIVGSKEERIRLLQEILWRDPGASTDDVVKPLIQYYWQQLSPEEAQLVAEIEGEDDTDGEDDHNSDGDNTTTTTVTKRSLASGGDSGNKDLYLRRRNNMTFEEENREIAEFEVLLDEYGLDDPYSPYLLDVVENLAFLGRDKNMGKFEGPDRLYEFSDETGEGIYETKRRFFAWPGRMMIPDKEDREDEERSQENMAEKDKKKTKQRPLSMTELSVPPHLTSQSMERSLTGGVVVEQIQLRQLRPLSKEEDLSFHQHSGHNEDSDSEDADEDDDDGEEGSDPELLVPGTDIGTVRILQKLNRHQPPVEPFRPILEMLLRRAEFGVLSEWEEEELMRICNLFCFCCLYCR
ncbi:hypothetical protein BGZ73_003024 [Actinomortierella ambigua]|nr:hypothetical protein BGZ73_003024 [Actinomortierella ambigua]